MQVDILIDLHLLLTIIQIYSTYHASRPTNSVNVRIAYTCILYFYDILLSNICLIYELLVIILSADVCTSINY